jgi:hypothetical protein
LDTSHFSRTFKAHQGGHRRISPPRPGFLTQRYTDLARGFKPQTHRVRRLESQRFKARRQQAYGSPRFSSRTALPCVTRPTQPAHHERSRLGAVLAYGEGERAAAVRRAQTVPAQKRPGCAALYLRGSVGLPSDELSLPCGRASPRRQSHPSTPAAPGRDTREPAITSRRPRIVNLPEPGHDWRTTFSPRTARVCRKISKVR